MKLPGKVGNWQCLVRTWRGSWRSWRSWMEMAMGEMVLLRGKSVVGWKLKAALGHARSFVPAGRGLWVLQGRPFSGQCANLSWGDP